MNDIKSGYDGKLVQKYVVTKADGTPNQLDVLYFVLRLDGNGERFHTIACRKAILTYADEIKDTYPVLSKDIKDKLASLENIDKLNDKISLLQKALESEKEKVKL